MAGKEDTELEAAKVFIRNLTKASSTKRLDHPCYENCDCYIEIEPTIAAGKAGYRYGM